MSTLTTIIIFFSLISLSLSVPYDKEYVESVCKETDIPEICIECIESSQGAQAGTKVEIASSVIECLKGSGSQLASKMGNISSTSKDPNAKKVFSVCAKLYSNSNKSLDSAIANLKVDKYDEAERAVTWTLIRQDGCLDEIIKHKGIELADDVVHEMKMYEGLAQASSRIIERL